MSLYVVTTVSTCPGGYDAYDGAPYTASTSCSMCVFSSEEDAINGAKRTILLSFAHSNAKAKIFPNWGKDDYDDERFVRDGIEQFTLKGLQVRMGHSEKVTVSPLALGKQYFF